MAAGAIFATGVATAVAACATGAGWIAAEPPALTTFLIVAAALGALPLPYNSSSKFSKSSSLSSLLLTAGVATTGADVVFVLAALAC